LTPNDSNNVANLVLLQPVPRGVRDVKVFFYISNVLWFNTAAVRFGVADAIRCPVLFQCCFVFVLRDYWFQHLYVLKIKYGSSRCYGAWGMLYFIIIPRVQTKKTENKDQDKATSTERNPRHNRVIPANRVNFHVILLLFMQDISDLLIMHPDHRITFSFIVYTIRRKNSDHITCSNNVFTKLK
jgi:hypothetical protein